MSFSSDTLLTSRSCCHVHLVLYECIVATRKVVYDTEDLFRDILTSSLHLTVLDSQLGTEPCEQRTTMSQAEKMYL